MTEALALISADGHAGPPVGNTRAVVWILANTIAGDSVGSRERISDAMPTTWGVAMLVPW